MKIFVIGAGVSGLALGSFLENQDITIIERNEIAGRKLLATGNGRCNFTNLNLKKENYHGRKENFQTNALENFSNKDLLTYFEKLGIEWTSLPSGRCYPKTMSSKTVRDILYLRARDNAKFIFNEKIVKIDLDKKLIISEKNKYRYDILVLATGGVSLKNSGSDGSIFKILENKVKIEDISYGITNYKTFEKIDKTAKGVKVNARADLFIDNKKVISSTDDIIFQSYGLTGTAILDLSNYISKGLQKKKNIRVDIDFYPEYEHNKLLARLANIHKAYPKRNAREILLGLVNEKLIIDIEKRARIKKGQRKINIEDLKKLTQILKKFSFTIKDIYDKTNAQVTLGGFSTCFINNKTMESKKYKGLYFIGETMDVAGDCGGYNIQWAFSSAKACADDIRSKNV